MRTFIPHIEDDFDKWMQSRYTEPGKILSCLEAQPIYARTHRRFRRQQIAKAAVAVRHSGAERKPLLTLLLLKLDSDALSRQATRDVQDVRRYCAHRFNHLFSRKAVISSCCCAASRNSAFSSLASRFSRVSSISRAVFPAAQMRNTRPKRSS